MTHSDDAHEVEDHDLGLSHDLPTIVERQRLARRGMLAIFGGLGVAAVAGCAADSSAAILETTASTGAAGAPPSGGGVADGSSVEVADGEIPEETAGPFPGDGSNGPDVLTESGIVRSDITSSFGDASGVADGVPVTVKLTVFDLNGDAAAPLVGAAVSLWHCDRDGSHSLYSDAAAGENYLRGVQETAEDGSLEFTTIVPACYSGRWPHMHVEVYESLDAATSASTQLRTSQLALPQDVCEAVYATAGYEQSVANLAQVSLDSDRVFADGHSLQMAKVTGSDKGYVTSLNIPV